MADHLGRNPFQSKKSSRAKAEKSSVKKAKDNSKGNSGKNEQGTCAQAIFRATEMIIEKLPVKLPVKLPTENLAGAFQGAVSTFQNAFSFFDRKRPGSKE